MDNHRISRIVAMLCGAAMIFVLEQNLGVQFYFAIPAGILAYVAVLVGMGFALRVNPPAK
jgi:urea transporter